MSSQINEQICTTDNISVEQTKTDDLTNSIEIKSEYYYYATVFNYLLDPDDDDENYNMEVSNFLPQPIDITNSIDNMPIEYINNMPNEDINNNSIDIDDMPSLENVHYVIDIPLIIISILLNQAILVKSNREQLINYFELLLKDNSDNETLKSYFENMKQSKTFFTSDQKNKMLECIIRIKLDIKYNNYIYSFTYDDKIREMHLSDRTIKTLSIILKSNNILHVIPTDVV